MSLRSTPFVVLSVAVGLFAVSAFFVQRALRAEITLELDQAIAQQTADRLKDALDLGLELSPGCLPRADWIGRIRDRTGAAGLRVWFHDPAASGKDLNELVAGGRDGPLVRVLHEHQLEVLGIIDAGIDEVPLIFRAVVERPSSPASLSVARFAFLATCATALLLLVLYRAVRKTVVEPLASTTKAGCDEPSESPVAPDRKDEIDDLSHALQKARERLATAEGSLLDMARKADQSEISSGLLHNIGNVLNSVNISSVNLAKMADELAVDDLEAMNGIIAEHAADLAKFLTEDERGRHFPPFLEALSTQMAQGRASISEEITSLSEGIARIRDMISSQQEYVRRGRDLEEVALDSLIRKALQLSERVQAFGRDLTVEVDLADLPEQRFNRHDLLEILVNLIQNARQAMEHLPDAPQHLSVSLQPSGNDQVCIEVTDTGCGISEEDLTRIFDCGFTTKPTGNGFGLHTAAKAAAAMGGTLQAMSDGPGSGATFRLQLPARPEAEQVELS